MKTETGKKNSSRSSTMAEEALILSHDRQWHETTDWRRVNGWVEITTPWLDCHNDFVQLYLRKEAKGYRITDDSQTLSDLALSGLETDLPSICEGITAILDRGGIERYGEELQVWTTEEDFRKDKHRLVETILSLYGLLA